MNIAVIFAGGTGQRMNTKSKPKQFLDVYGKPVIVHTLEHFQYHARIDTIVVVCLEQWIPYCRELVKKFCLMKVEHIVPGGASAQQSIFNGLKCVYDNYAHDAVILIHDGVRPLINEQLISDNIDSVRKSGSAITVSPAIETIVVKSDDDGKIGNILERSKCEMAKAPQSFVLEDIYNAHFQAQKEGCKDNFIDSASLMKHYGYALATVVGPTENIKITTPFDFYLFRAILDAKENLQIMGM